MVKPIRPLTLKERKKPAQLMFEGGFKNTSFQIGEIVLKAGQDWEQSGPGIRQAVLKKTEKLQIPVLVPCSVAINKGDSNIVCSVYGRKNPIDGLHDTFLVVRNIERLSSFNTKLRTINDLRAVDAEGEATTERLGKGDTARQHNQVNLSGVVVGSSFENGEHPKFHIQLRQTNNPDNIIHLIYDAKNAGALNNHVRFGSMIYVEGEYAFRKIPVLKLDAEGKPVFNENGQHEYQTDDNGEVIKRIHSYVRIGAPKQMDFEYDINFKVTEPPRWIDDLLDEMERRRQRVNTTSEANPQTAPAPTPAAGAINMNPSKPAPSAVSAQVHATALAATEGL